MKSSPLTWAACLIALSLAAGSSIASAGQSSTPAYPILDSAKATARELKSLSAKDANLVLIARGYADIGAYEEAHLTLTEAAELTKAQDRSPTVISRAARILLDIGRHEEALETARTIPDASVASRLLVEIAERLHDEDRGNLAASACESARNRTADLETPAQRLGILAALAQTYLALGERETAEELLAAAVEAAIRVDAEGATEAPPFRLVLSCWELGYPGLAERLVDSLEKPAGRFAVTLELSLLHRDAGHSRESNDLSRAAQNLKSSLPASRRVRLQSDLAGVFDESGREDLALQVLRLAEAATAEVGDANERIVLIQHIATRYFEHEQWDAAADLAVRASDPYAECKYRTVAVLARAKDSGAEQALQMIRALDTEYLRFVGYDNLNELAALYHHAAPAASVEEVARLEPEEFRDRALVLYAESAASLPDYPATFSFIAPITSNARRRDALMAAAKQFLRSANARNLETVGEWIKRCIDELQTTEDRTDVLYRLASVQVDGGQPDRALETVDRIRSELPDEDAMDETRYTGLARMGAILWRMERLDDALDLVHEAAEEAMFIPCASCRHETVKTIVETLLESRDAAPLATALELLQLPSFQALELPRLADEHPDMTADQRRLLMRCALRGATDILLADNRIEAMVSVARAYRDRGLQPDSADLAVLENALPAQQRPEGTPARVMRPGGGLDVALLAVFTRSGCDACEEAEEAIRKAAERLPTVETRVKFYLLDGKNAEEARRVNGAICEMLDVPKHNRLLAPSVFSLQQGLFGDEITVARVAFMIENCVGLPSPEVQALPYAEDEDTTLEQYRALTPIAVVIGGLTDGINPCAFAVLVFFISYLTYVGRTRRQIVTAGIVFTIAVFLTYFAIGLGLGEVLGMATRRFGRISRVIGLVIAGAALVAAVLSFLDGIRCLRGEPENMTLALPDSLKKRIRLNIARRTRTGLTVVTTAVLGAIVALFEFPCTGWVYLPIIALIRRPGHFWGPTGWLLLYNFFFIVPLIVVFALVLFGVTSDALSAWFRRHIAKTKFAMSAVFLILFALLVWQNF